MGENKREREGENLFCRYVFRVCMCLCLTLLVVRVWECDKATLTSDASTDTQLDM